MAKNWTDERLEERFDRIDYRFDSIDRRFEAVDRRFDAMQRTMIQFSGALIAVLIAALVGIFAQI